MQQVIARSRLLKSTCESNAVTGSSTQVKFYSMVRKPSNVTRLHEQLDKRIVTSVAITQIRNSSFGSAAFCLVILLGLAQIEARNEIGLQLSMCSVALALPLWLLLGIIYEHYLALGERSYPHIDTPAIRNLTRWVGVFAGTGFVFAAGGLIYFLNLWAFWLFLATTVLGVLCWILFQRHLARWLYAPDGPRL